MTGFYVAAWPDVDERLGATIRALLLERQVPESTLDAATHVFLLIPAAGDEAESPLPVDDERIIPVVVGSSPSPIMSRRSQLVIPEEELPRAADRLASLARLTGAQLVAANRLRSSALHWSSSGRDASLLLPAAELPAATQVFLAGVSVGMSDDTTRAYLDASRSTTARRVRRQAGALGVAVVALLVATILAIQLSISSQRAAVVARAREAEARSIRLAGQAEALLADGSDPDLPWLLSDAALRAHPTQEAEIAARVVAATTPAHRTAHLANGPRQVALTPDGGTVAVTYDDGSAEIFDDELAQVRTIPAFIDDEPARSLAISADGQCVAVSSGSTVGTDCGDSRHVWELDASIVGLGWRDSHLVVVARDGIRTGLPGSDPAGRLPIDLDAEILDASITPDGQQAALATMAGSMLVELDGGATVLTGAGGDRVAVHPSGGQFLVRESSGLTVLAEIPDDAPGSADPANPARAALVSMFPGAPYLTTPRVNTICAADRLEHGQDSCFVAHAGGVLDADGTSDGTVASIGSDNRLRLWRDVHPRSHVVPGLAGRGLGGDFDPRQGNRVTWNAEDSQVMALRYDTGVLGVFEDLEFTKGQFFGLQLGTPIGLSSDGAAVARWVDGTLTCRSTLNDGWPIILEADTDTQLPPRPHHMAPASDCSVTVACYESDCYRVDASGIQQLQAPNPIGLGTDRKGAPEIHFADGSAQSAWGHGVLGAGEPAMSATSLADRVAWVTSANQLRTAGRWGEPLELLQLPRSWEVLRTELLADGELVAVHARDRMLIAATRAPNDLRYVGPGLEATYGSHDVTVAGDGAAITVSSELGLKREPLETLAGLHTRIGLGVPRELTAAEGDEFGVIG